MRTLYELRVNNLFLRQFMSITLSIIDNYFFETKIRCATKILKKIKKFLAEDSNSITKCFE